MCEIYFKCLGILITNNARRIREFSQGGCGKAAFNKKKILSTGNWNYV